MTQPGVVAARARAAIAIGRHDHAVQLVSTALASEPASAELWNLLAQAKLEQGQPREALDAARHATGLAPEAEWGHRLTSLALLRLNKPGEALPAAETATLLAPHAWQVHANQALVYAALKRVEHGLAAAERAATLAPNEPQVHFVRGRLHYVAKQWDLAEAAFRHALSIDPQHSASINELGRLGLQRKELGSAAQTFVTAVRTDPSQTVSKFNLDLTIRIFLARAAWWLFLPMIVVARITASASKSLSTDRSLRLVVVAGSVFGLFLVWRKVAAFVGGLSGDLRRYFFYTLRHGVPVVATALEAYAVIALLALAIPEVPPGVTLTALPCVVVARVILYLERKVMVRRRRRR